jgi:hypothetical protein
MAYHGSTRRSAGEVEADRNNLAAWVENQRKAGVNVPGWKLARLQGYEDALDALEEASLHNLVLRKKMRQHPDRRLRSWAIT